MVSQLPSPKSRIYARTGSITLRQETPAALIPASRVKELLREIAIALHGSRAATARRANVPKKG